jgi:Right handed beta helix region
MYMDAKNRNALFLSWFGVLFTTLAITFSGFAQTQLPNARDDATAPVANTSTTADFYVALNGNDTWPGTLSQPFLTVDRARLAVQALKQNVSGRTITVFIRGGTYYLPSTWTFTSLDSGTSTTPILYANYPGEIVILSAGRRLTGWIQNANGSWQTTLPSGTYFTQMWINGSRRYRPRTTPTSYLYITGEFSTTGSSTTVNQLSYATPPPGGVPSTMANLADVELINFEAWDVAHMRISSVNISTQRITTTASITKNAIYLGFIPGHHFLLENVKEALKQPGQFYLDRPTEVLTYLPKAGETITNTTIVAPRLLNVLTASNLSNVTFQGLTFSHSDWQVPAAGYLGAQADSGIPAAVSLTNPNGVVFEQDTISHVGAYGIEFLQTGVAAGTSSYLAQFRDGLLTDLGGGGIRIGKRVTSCNTNDKVPQNVYIANNMITGGGRVAPAGYAILVGDAHHVMIEHNEIYDFYNNGIGVGFNWDYACNLAHDNVVQFNSLHDLGQGVTSDLGGVYYLSGINTGNKVLNNKVHDITHDPAGYGGWGLYADQGAMEVLFQNNLVYRTTDTSLHVNSAATAPPISGTPPNVFKNNILAYGAMGAMDRHNDTTFLSFLFENNIFYYNQAAIQYGYWYCQGKAVCTDYFQFDNNLYFDAGVSGGQPSQPFFKTPSTAPNVTQQPTPITPLTLQQWQSQGEDLRSLFADPLFIDPTPGTDNYTLESSSPAFTLGFVAFDPSQAGVLSTFPFKAPLNPPAFPLLTTPIVNFNLTATPASQTVTQGGKVTYSAAIGAVNGFTGTVRFAASGLPTGATASFSPTSVSGSGVSTLTVSTNSSTPNGTYPVTITATSGTLQHTAQVTLVVSAATLPDFSLAVTPASRTIAQNANNTYTLTVSPLNGFNGVVTFAASGLPAGGSANFAPTSITGSGSTTMTLACTGTTVPGNYTVTVIATSGSIQHTTTVALTITGFSLSVSPTSQQVTGGSAATYTATVTDLNGYSATETMSVTGVPSGATATFSPSSISGSGTATLKVQTATSTPTRAYTLTIKATSSSGSLYHTSVVSLSVQ